MGARNAKADLKRYRDGYPGLEDDLRKEDNWLFYSGEIESVPHGDYIDVIHQTWKGDYPKLEVHHGYIQWLFPIREHGMNSESQPLQLHEIEKIKGSPEAIERFLKSYEMQLHFYGCVLDRETGKLSRGDNWEQQYRNLNTHSHNFLRITRILKCLGELGFERYQKPFMDHFVEEIWQHKTLGPCGQSCRSFWIGTIRDDKERAEVKEKIHQLSGVPVSDSEEDEPVQRGPPSHRAYHGMQVGTPSRKTDDEIEAEREAFRKKIATQSKTVASTSKSNEGEDEESSSDNDKYKKYLKYLSSSDDEDDGDYEDDGDDDDDSEDVDDAPKGDGDGSEGKKTEGEGEEKKEDQQ